MEGSGLTYRKAGATSKLPLELEGGHALQNEIS